MEKGGLELIKYRFRDWNVKHNINSKTHPFENILYSKLFKTSKALKPVVLSTFIDDCRDGLLSYFSQISEESLLNLPDFDGILLNQLGWDNVNKNKCIRGIYEKYMYSKVLSKKIIVVQKINEQIRDSFYTNTLATHELIDWIKLTPLEDILFSGELPTSVFEKLSQLVSFLSKNNLIKRGSIEKLWEMTTKSTQKNPYSRALSAIIKYLHPQLIDELSEIIMSQELTDQHIKFLVKLTNSTNSSPELEEKIIKYFFSVLSSNNYNKYHFNIIEQTCSIAKDKIDDERIINDLCKLLLSSKHPLFFSCILYIEDSHIINLYLKKFFEENKEKFLEYFLSKPDHTMNEVNLLSNIFPDPSSLEESNISLIETLYNQLLNHKSLPLYCHFLCDYLSSVSKNTIMILNRLLFKDKDIVISVDNTIRVI